MESEFEKRLNERAIILRDAAEVLKQRIIVFESYLAKMPGRVEASVSGKYLHVTDTKLALTIKREGKDWVLLSKLVPQGEAECNVVWKRLWEDSLKVKIASVDLFPALIEAVEFAQADLLKSLKQAGDTMDDFLATLPPHPQLKPKEVTGNK